MIDTHVHIYDKDENDYPILQIPSLSFAAFYGDYSIIPDAFLPTDLSNDFIAIEFGSTDPVKEAKWLATKSKAVVAKVELMRPETIDPYQAIPEVKVVREHLIYHPASKLKTLAKQPDLVLNPTWQKTFQSLPYTLEVRLFSTQIPDLIKLAQKFPSKRIIVSHMGFPLEGFPSWLSTMRELAKCENVAIKVCALESIFGIDYDPEPIAPWIQYLLDLFTPKRVMFGSNMPLCILSTKCMAPMLKYESLMVPKEHHQDVFINAPKDWYNLD
ncbi:MAG: hypothetical protein SP1CHLAM54_06430 [Chlamydiia bacterium]|nr:hypothetical protein [Chlamydiia bacterium]MCH9615553.1 hypothetical protein [Chlamydiia bacterium]MCH9629208.1 hypothetical protein [Chlamydiia bacterium]